jgi:outer membrane immunogenic protein
LGVALASPAWASPVPSRDAAAKPADAFNIRSRREMPPVAFLSILFSLDMTTWYSGFYTKSWHQKPYPVCQNFEPVPVLKPALLTKCQHEGTCWQARSKYLFVNGLRAAVVPTIRLGIQEKLEMLTKLAAQNARVGANSFALLVALACVLFATQSRAESGFFIGGSVGQAGLELNDGDPVLPVVFDESDLAYKFMAGYNWQFSLVSLGLEADYVNFGKPASDIPGVGMLEVETTGLSSFAVLGVQLGPIGVFGKYGTMSWDAEATFDGLTDPNGSIDGNEPMYGVGAQFGIGALDLRLEYEAIDLNADGVSQSDMNMVSLGLTWTF